jgi:hypothetical protein
MPEFSHTHNTVRPHRLLSRELVHGGWSFFAVANGQRPTANGHPR